MQSFSLSKYANVKDNIKRIFCCKHRNSNSLLTRQDVRMYGTSRTFEMLLAKVCLVSLPLLVPAIICMFIPHESYSLGVERDGQPTNLCVEIIRWSVYVSAMSFVAIILFEGYIIGHLCECLLRVIKRNKYEIRPFITNLLHHLIRTQAYVSFMLFCICVNLLTYNLIVDNAEQEYDMYISNQQNLQNDTVFGMVFNVLKDTIPDTGGEDSESSKIKFEKKVVFNWYFYYKTTARVLVSFSIGLFFEKLVLEYISFGFYKNAFGKRRYDVDSKVKSYLRIRRKIRKHTSKIFDEHNNGGSTDFTKQNPMGVDDIGRKHHPDTSDGSDGNSDEMDMSPETLDYQSEKIFHFFLQSHDRDYITKNDVKQYYRKLEDCLEDFELFGPKNTGRVSMKMVKNSLVNLSKEKASLEKSIKTHGKILIKLDNVMLIFMTIYTATISILYYQMSMSVYIISIIMLAFVYYYLMGDITKSVIEDFIYILITHLYDIGDKIVIDGSIYTVSKIHLSTTAFIRDCDGQLVYMSTKALRKKSIENIRRSKIQSEQIKIGIDGAIGLDTLVKLQDTVGEYLRQKPSAFTGNILLEDVKASEKSVFVTLRIQLCANFQDEKTRIANKLKVKMKIIESLRLLDLKMVSLE